MMLSNHKINNERRKGGLGRRGQEGRERGPKEGGNGSGEGGQKEGTEGDLLDCLH